MTFALAGSTLDRALRKQVAPQDRLAHFARYIMQAKGDLYSALRLADADRAPPEIIDALKAAVDVGSSLTGNWGNPLAQANIAVADFIGSLKDYGAFDQMLPFMKQVPLRTRVVTVTTGFVGTGMSPFGAKPISNLQLAGQQLNETIAAALLVLSDEVLKFGGDLATRLLNSEMRVGLAVATDTAFITKITTGISPTGTSGATGDKIWTDLETAVGALTLMQNSKVFAITTPAIAKKIATKNVSGVQSFPGIGEQGGAFGPTTLISSDGVPSGWMVVVDAAQLAANPGIVLVDQSNEAAVQLDTAPDSPQVAGTVLTSLWQTNCTGLRAERIFGVERPRTASVAVINNIAY